MAFHDNDFSLCDGLSAHEKFDGLHYLLIQFHHCSRAEPENTTQGHFGLSKSQCDRKFNVEKQINVSIAFRGRGRSRRGELDGCVGPPRRFSRGSRGQRLAEIRIEQNHQRELHILLVLQMETSLKLGLPASRVVASQLHVYFAAHWGFQRQGGCARELAKYFIERVLVIAGKVLSAVEGFTHQDLRQT